MRFYIIRNARIENVGKSQSCMVSKLRIIWKQTVRRTLWQLRSVLVRIVLVINLNNISYYLLLTWLPAYLANMRFWCEDNSGCSWQQQQVITLEGQKGRTH